MTQQLQGTHKTNAAEIASCFTWLKVQASGLAFTAFTTTRGGGGTSRKVKDIYELQRCGLQEGAGPMLGDVGTILRKGLQSAMDAFW